MLSDKLDVNWEPEAPPIVNAHVAEELPSFTAAPLVRRSTYARHMRRRSKPLPPAIAWAFCIARNFALTVGGGAFGLFLGAIISGVILGKSPMVVTREVLKSVGVELPAPPSHTNPANSARR
jgi:hypothetical protein